MQKIPSKKPLIITAIAIVLVGILYFYLTGTPSTSTSGIEESDQSSNEAATAGAKILTLLNKINTLHISAEFFNDPIYESLVDHTVIVPEQAVGKENPFVTYFGRSAPPPPPPAPVKK